MTKNITVTDANGDIIGTTYPKRAKGLVKNGRACYVGSGTIRMSALDASSDNMTISEEKSMNYITFNGDEWIRRDADISYMTSVMDGTLTEALMLGNWDDREKVARSKDFTLSPLTEYHFIFWLNGGENEKGDETCLFKVTFMGDDGNSRIYKLNRNFIHPLLHQKGWELYELPFVTPDVQDGVTVTFSFVAGKAPMAVLPAREPSAYLDLKDEPDEYEDYRPQRHNLVFKDGWPSISQYGGDRYSTQAIKQKLAGKRSKPEKGNDFFNITYSGGDIDEECRESLEESLYEEAEQQCDELEDMLDELEDRLDDIKDELDDAEDELDDIMDEDDFKQRSDFGKITEMVGQLGILKAKIPGYEAALKGYAGAVKNFSKNLGKSMSQEMIAQSANLRSIVEAFEEKISSFQDQVNDFVDSISSLQD